MALSPHIQQYLREIDSSLYPEFGQMDYTELNRNMNLTSTLPEYTKPKNVALMFFCLKPEKYLPYAQIDVVQFLDDLGGDQIIEQTVPSASRALKPTVCPVAATATAGSASS